MDLKRGSVPEGGAYRIVQNALNELKVVERSLAISEQAETDPERALHLATVRVAIDQLENFVRT
jgi:hypothetical protein